MAADAVDPYAPAKPAEPKGRVGGLLTLLAVLLLVFVIAKVAGTISSNSAVFEDQFAVQSGDNVTVQYTIRSAASGRVLSTTSGALPADDGHDHEHAEASEESAVRFQVGSGESGYGEDFERAIVGHYAGETVRWGPVSGEAAFGEWTPLANAFPRTYGPFELEQTLDSRFIDAYEAQVGPLNEGDTIRVFRDFPWDQRVTEKANGTVVVRHDIEDGDSYPWEVPPSDLVLVVDDAEGTFTIRFDVEEGTTFAVEQGSAGAVFFSPGSYRVDEVTDTDIVLEYSAAPDPRIVEDDVIVEIKILAIES